MSEKHLSEAEWKKFAKGRGLKDAAMISALAAWAKAEKLPPGEQLQPLVDLQKQAETLRKAGKADKELTGYLDELDAALKKQRATTEGAAKSAPAESAEDDGDDSPALLTTKIVALMREVPKGAVLHALIGTDGKAAAVLVQRKPTTAAQRKLLNTRLGVSGGLKYIVGQCLFEANMHTFVVQGPAAGLAKRLKAALLAQTDLRYKVRVRGEDPNDVDEDIEDGEDGELVEASGAAPAAAEAATEAAAEAAAAVDETALAAWRERLKALMPAVQQALANPAADSSRLRAVLQFSREKSAGGQFEPAMKALDMVEQLLAAVPAAAAGEAAASAPPRAVGSKVKLARSKLAWNDAKKAVAAQLAQLRSAVLQEFAEEAEAVARLDEILDGFNQGLGDRLDDLYNAAEGPERDGLRERAAAIAEDYLAFLQTSPLVEHVEEHPFDSVLVSVRQTLCAPLRNVRQLLV